MAAENPDAIGQQAAGTQDGCDRDRILRDVGQHDRDPLTRPQAQALEASAERVSNVTYTAPTETGEAETVVDATTASANMPRVGRNDPCPCGSGKKFKQCHGKLS